MQLHFWMGGMVQVALSKGRQDGGEFGATYGNIYGQGQVSTLHPKAFDYYFLFPPTQGLFGSSQDMVEAGQTPPFCTPSQSDVLQAGPVFSPAAPTYLWAPVDTQRWLSSSWSVPSDGWH